MKLVILHYHLRPGGIRRVIELATRHILYESGGRLKRVTLATGEPSDQRWRTTFETACDGMPVEFFIEPAFCYLSEQTRAPSVIRNQIRRGLERLFKNETPDSTIVWAHNLGLARNMILTQELIKTCDTRHIPLLAHHHDWWFDSRWQRWPEMRRMGFRTLASAATAVFGSTKTRYLSINHADWSILRKHFGSRATWLPNLAERKQNPPKPAVIKAGRWLQSRLDHDHAPVWILPCRLLRRKNVAEALLLKRWLRPESWLVTTGGVSSAEERAYYAKLDQAARKHHWRIRLGVLEGDETRKPAIAELLAASEAVLLTSVQEGFGLPYLEAAAAGRPLIARNLPNVAPDLAKFGFTFPQSYDEILIHPSLFDWHSEELRQQKLYARWKWQLPRQCREWAGKPPVLASFGKPRPVPFSRLTLTAQIEVLAQPLSQSWELCLPLNPFLNEWQRRACVGKLRVTKWPGSAEDWLSGKAYGQRFHEALKSGVRGKPSRNAPVAAQTEFMHVKLAPRYLYPLLWSNDT